MTILGAAGPVAQELGRLVAPGGLNVLGPPANVWLAALGLVLLGPALATLVPRLLRPLGAFAAVCAVLLAFVAAYREQPILALALITFAVTAGVVSSWSRGTLRRSIGPRRPDPRPTKHVVRGTVLRGAYAREFDRLAARTSR
jgi:hypothetical protein